MLRFKNKKGVVSRRLRIFAMKYVCFVRKRNGALGGDTILRRPRAIYIYLNGFIRPKTSANGWRPEVSLPHEENRGLFSPVGSP